MVQELHPDDLARRPQPRRQRHIVGARRGVARRMVVEGDDGGGAGEERFAEDVTRRRQAGIERSYRKEPRREEPMAGVEEDEPEALHRKRAEPRQKVCREVA